VFTVLAACAGPPKPHAQFANLMPELSYVVGQPIPVEAGWYALCTEEVGVKQTVTAEVPCHRKPIEVRITCSAPCEVSPAAGQDGEDRTVEVTAFSTGRMRITAVVRRTDTGESQRFDLPIVTVVMPERIGLRCQAEPSPARRSVPCGPEGVPARSPLVQPVVEYAMREVTSAALQINGRQVRLHDGTVSLAELYPAAASGDGIVPGTYEVALSLGGMTSRWQVVAR
jgi:hypothetical protein